MGIKKYVYICIGFTMSGEADILLKYEALSFLVSENVRNFQGLQELCDGSRI